MEFPAVLTLWARVMRKSIFAIILTTVFSASSALPLPGISWAEEAPGVKVIEVKGLRRIEEGAVRGRIAQRLGAPLSTETVSGDIKALYGMGYFEDVRVEVEPFEGGVRLVYILKEKPSVRRVEIYGNEDVGDSKLTDKLTISPGSIADTVLIKSNADIILSTYEEEGHPFAVVVPVLRETSPGSVLVTYYIKEGRKVKIKDVVIRGNREVSSRRIKKAMDTSEWGIFSWATSGGYYEKDTVASDLEKIKELYHDLGYIKADVSGPFLELSEDRKRMSIAVEVDEGRRYDVSAVEFEGNTVFTGEELRKRVGSSPGRRLSRKTLRGDVGTLTGMYTERGYALASIYPDVEPDDEAREARVIFRVTEDEIYRVGRIEVSGNLKTRDRVIRRELRLDEGDVFNSKRLSRSYQRLVNLNFFEEIKMNPVPRAEEKKLDVDIDVAERSTGFLNIGGGYSSTDKIIGMADMTLGNLGGRGQYLKVKAEFSSRTTTYELAFKEPWLFDKPVSLNASMFRTEREFSSYSKKAIGFTLGIGRSFREFWRASVFYRLEEATIFELAEDATSIIREQEGTRLTSSISPSLTRDSRDNFLNPHRGSRNSVFLTYAGLGGDNKFIKAQVDSSWHIPVSKRTTFSARARYGSAAGVEGEELPLYERFLAGSASTLRGHRKVGPRDAEGNYIGGEQRLLFNFDYTFPLLGDIHLNGNIFYDIGAAFDNSIRNFRESAGGGLRWISPIGPIRLEWAYLLDREADEPSSRWEFSLGTFF
jgi:outer membrane protein insertion porin family